MISAPTRGKKIQGKAVVIYPDHKKYRVAESFKRKGFNKPKAGKIRFVDFPPSLVKELEACISQLKKQGLKQGKGGHVDLLFIDPKENGPWPYSQRKIQGLMRRVCKAAGLQSRNPHDLQHTYASMLLMAHKSPAFVKKQLGHSTIDTTVDIYGHWIDEEGRDGLKDALKISEVVPNPDGKSHIIAYKPKRLQ